jgi:6-phosphogluconolactonase
MAGRTFLFIGCLNRRLPYFPSANGKGIAVFAFDPETGDGQPVSLTEGIDNPAYLSFDPRRSCLYANSEVSGWNEGTATAYRFDPASGRLRYINEQPTLGATAAYNSLSRDGRFLLVANYGDEPADALPGKAAAVFQVRRDGGLAPACGSIAHQGSGPNKERQERPHAHCIIPAPDGERVIVADLGIDAVLRHRLGSDGSLNPDPEPLRLPPGSGPRHIALHPSQRFAYVINELNSTICVLAFEGQDGFRMVEVVPTVPSNTGAENYPADLYVSRDGRFLYASNRGHDSIVTYSIDDVTGRLTLIGHQPCGGKTPRSFAIDVTGQWLLVANQNSDSVAVFGIDPQSGGLSDTGRRLETGTPMCVKFAGALSA